jgi:hypothetical protein
MCFVVKLQKFELKIKEGTCSLQKKPFYRPLEEKGRMTRLSCPLSHRKQKDGTEKAKKQQQSV